MTFQWPLLLISLGLVPVLIALYLSSQRRRRAYAVRFTNLALLREVAPRAPGRRRHLPPLLFLLGLTALLVGLARPTAVIAVPRDQTAVMLVLDVSGSMVADDLRPNRMVAAKGAARAFVEELPDDMQVGLVTFASNATLNAALTRDHAAVDRTIEGLTTRDSTAIGEGLNLALEQLARRPLDDEGRRAPGLVVLLSDGESNAGMPPAEAASRAKGEGVTVHTVGIGQRGSALRINGRTPVSLDERTLQSIASETGGDYFYAADGGALERVYEELGSQISWIEERTEVTALVNALGALFLIAGGLLGLRWFQQFP